MKVISVPRIVQTRQAYVCMVDASMCHWIISSTGEAGCKGMSLYPVGTDKQRMEDFFTAISLTVWKIVSFYFVSTFSASLPSFSPCDMHSPHSLIRLFQISNSKLLAGKRLKNPTDFKGEIYLSHMHIHSALHISQGHFFRV